MSEKVQTEAEVRAIGIRQLDRMIDYLTSMRDGVKKGMIHYHGGEMMVSEESDLITETRFTGDMKIRKPDHKSWRLHGDLVFGTQKEQINETDQ